MSARTLRRGFTSLLCGACICVLIVESLGRLLHWRQPYSSLFEHDAQTGLTTPKGKTVRVQSGGDTYTVQFDADGYIDRTGQEASIVVVGDGAVAGTELQPHERLAHLLASKESVDGVNLSVTGHGTLQQVQSLETYLARVGRKPMTIIWVFNLSNDLIDNVCDWDGTGGPCAWLTKPKDIQPPHLPSLGYRILRTLYLNSYFSQEMLSLTGLHRSPAEMTAFIPCITTDEGDCKQSMEICAEAFSRLQDIVERHKLRVVGILWDDIDIAPYPEQAVADLSKKIVGLAPFVEWTGRTEFASDRQDWAKDWLAVGTRHANARATRWMAERLQVLLRNN